MLRIQMLLHSPSGGGAQRRTLQLAQALDARVELLLVETGGPLPLPETVKVSTLPSDLTGLPWVRANRMRQMAAAIPALAARLRRDPPDILMAAANHAHLTALFAHFLAGRPCPLVLRASNHLGGGRGQMFDLLKRRSVALYRLADCVVAVSDDIAAQLRALAPRAAIRLLPNPVVDAGFAARMAQPPPHPWLDGPVPVVLGMGRLEKQKDFPTLIRAVRRLGVRLIILGEGKERPRLEEMCQGMEACLPGFVDDPLPWLAHASAFALSSAWEGMPGALIEAMACGCPVVATRCPGASEVLLDGRLGPLVPVGDDAALAEALRNVLGTPPDRRRLMRRADNFSVEAGAQAYLDLFTELSARRGR